MRRLLLFLLCVPCVWGLPSVNFSQPSEMVLFKDNSQAFLINVTNVGNESLFNLSCGDGSLLDFGLVEEILPGQSAQLSVRGLSHDTFSVREISQSCSFFYREMFVFPLQTWAVTYGSSFVPYSVEASAGDFLVFANNGSANIRVKEFNESFVVQEILPNQTGTPITLSNNLVYYNFYTGSSGVVNVLNRSRVVLKHSPELDSVLKINVSSVYQDADLSVDVYDSSFELGNRKSRESVIKVSNVGNYPAIGVNLSMNWSAFSYLGSLVVPFNLGANESRFINVIVTPFVNETENTNKTYTLELKVWSNNAGTEKKTISVFVPFENLSVAIINSSKPQYIISVPWTIDYCRNNKNDSQCDQLYNNFTTVQVLEKSLNVSLNMTEEQRSRFVQCFLDGGCMEKLFKIQNEYGNVTAEQILEIKGRLASIDSNSISADALNKQLQDSEERLKNAYYSLFIVLYAVICLTAGFFIYKWIEKKRKTGEAYL